LRKNKFIFCGQSLFAFGNAGIAKTHLFRFLPGLVMFLVADVIPATSSVLPLPYPDFAKILILPRN